MTLSLEKEDPGPQGPKSGGGFRVETYFQAWNREFVPTDGPPEGLRLGPASVMHKPSRISPPVFLPPCPINQADLAAHAERERRPRDLRSQDF